MARSAESIRELLKVSGVRGTPGRISVLRVLVNTGRPMSHSQISEKLGGDPMDRVTLYRTLAALQGAGLVHRVQGKDAIWHFCAHAPGTVGCPGNHPHFLCLQCGGMRCLSGQSLPRIAVDSGDEVMGKQFVVYGRCAKCSRGRRLESGRRRA